VPLTFLFFLFRQFGVTLSFCFLYSSLGALFSFFGGFFMDSSLPADLLDLKNQFDSWRLTRKKRAAIPDDLRLKAQAMLARYPAKTICSALRLHPRSLKDSPASSASKQPASRQSQAAFLPLSNPASALQPPPFSTEPSHSALRLMLERTDGSRLTLLLPSLDASALLTLCTNFLRF
jgi:hypothetical protein